MKYTAYPQTIYEYKTTIPEHKIFRGISYELVEVFANYNGFAGHKTALNFAQDLRAQGSKARIVAHSGFTAVYAK